MSFSPGRFLPAGRRTDSISSRSEPHIRAPEMTHAVDLWFSIRGGWCPGARSIAPLGPLVAPTARDPHGGLPARGAYLALGDGEAPRNARLAGGGAPRGGRVEVGPPGGVADGSSRPVSPV